MSKTLVLIRHAHRDNSQREVDNGLDDKGREQAKSIRRFFMDRFATDEFKRGLWFVSSPKQRCLETLLPTAKGLERSVDVHPDLDEQSLRESGTAFEARIQHFLQEWKQSKAELTVACSHGDWLPMAAYALLGFPQDFKKGAWLEVEWNGGRAALKWYVPSFKALYK